MEHIQSDNWNLWIWILRGDLFYNLPIDSIQSVKNYKSVIKSFLAKVTTTTQDKSMMCDR